MAYILLAGDFPPQVGGIQSYHSSLARALTALGRTVHVIATAQPGDREHDAGCPFAVTRVPGGGGKLALTRRMRDTALGVAPGLGRRVRGIIATKWSPESPGAWQAARQLGTPWAIFGHDREFILTALNGLKWAVQRHCLTQADFCFAISHYAAANFRRRGVPEHRIRMVGGGVEAGAFAPDPERAAQLRQQLDLGDGPVLVTVSRLVQKKGHLTVLRSLPAVQQALGPVRYLIVGDGPCRGELQAAVRELGLGSQVVLTGRAPQADLCGYYTLADVMVMVSHDVPGEPTEGFGLAYLEANCCDTPVIGSRGGGIPDAVDHGVSGLLVPPRDPRATAQAIISLLGDPNRAREMGRQGAQRARQGFRWELVARRVDACFDELER